MGVTAVIGAQYGSEGKGVIIANLADKYDIHVRVGGPNAGHSFWDDQTNREWKMQIIPVGWKNRGATCYLGRGMLIDVAHLRQEIEEIEKYEPNFARNRLRIDALAGTILPSHRNQEGGVDGELHHRIGSTGEGVGAARVDRVRRDPERFKLFKDVAAQFDLTDSMVSETPGLIQDASDRGQEVLLEGTQGSGLSLIHGPWPYVTSTDTNVAQLLADVGLAPSDLSNVVLVARTFPIRVAGNSGPLRSEVGWDVISARMGRPTEERTTVTKKVRRIGQWDPDLLRRAIRLNRPTSLAVTFIDYLFPTCEGAWTWDGLSEEAQDWVYDLEKDFGVRVARVATGGTPVAVIELGPV